MMKRARRGSVLIVIADRKDRRELFDLFDAQGFDAIYTATNIEQARDLIARDPRIYLLLIEYPGAGDSEAFCAEIATSRNPAHFHIIGIASDAAGKREADNDASASIHDWIARPIDAREVTAILDGLAIAEDPEAALAAHAGNFRFAFDNSQQEYLLVDPDSGRIIDANRTLLKHWGATHDRIVGMVISQLDGIESRQQREQIIRTLAARGNVRYRTRRVVRPGADPILIHVHVQRVVHDGSQADLYAFRRPGVVSTPAEALALVDDFARESAAGASIETSMRELIDGLTLDFALFAYRRPGLESDQEVLALYQRTGVAAPISEALALDQIRLMFRGTEVVIDGRVAKVAEGSPLADSDFECIIGLPLKGDTDTGSGALLLARRRPLGDPALVTAIRILGHQWMLQLGTRLAHEEGRSVGMRDGLTTLPNRLLFNDRLEAVLHEAHGTGEMFAVVFVDVDRFKNINDSLGRAAGDRVLAAVADRLRACVGVADIIARYAGDEFTLILRHISQREDALRIAEKIVSRMAAPLHLGSDVQFHVTVSLGLSFYPDDAADGERLLKQAGMAMYAAKDLGRNTHQAYVAVPEESSRQRLELEAQLHRAEHNDELRVHYQPQISAQTGDLIGMEALLRWQHPQLGMISPGFFIPLAEELGTILGIGEWILRAACSDARRWQERFELPLRLGVNLSPLQLRQPSLLARVTRIFEETGIDAACVDFEITENIDIRSIPNLLITLNGLHGLGCGISIDDFGTGQSSLDYLKQLPADRIKIDQGFVRNIGIDPDDEAIVKATISMAHSLNRQVVSEGVETEAQHDFLIAQSSDFLQGYLYCRPLPAAAFEAMLVERETKFQSEPLEI